MSKHHPTSDHDRLRGWSLAALYVSFAVLSLMLIFAAFKFWPATSHAEMEVMAVVITGCATVLTGIRSAIHFTRAMRAGGPVPHMALAPFVCITLTLIASGYLFGAL